MKRNLIFILSGLLIPVFLFADFANKDKQFFAIKNLLNNPGFEQGKTKWSVQSPSGSFSLSTTAAHVASGSASASFTGTTNGQQFGASLVTIPAGLYNRNCLASVSYKGGDSNLLFKVEDGSGNSLAYVNLSAQTGYKREHLPFVCPSSGTVRPVVQSQASATQVYVDDFYIGENHLIGNHSSASLFGGATHAATASCSWSSTSSSFGNFSADSDCPTPTLQGQGLAPSTKVPGVRFASIPPGRYMVVATGLFDRGNVNTVFNARFHDGTTGSSAMRMPAISSATSITSGSLIGWFDYTTAQSATTIQIQIQNGDNTTSNTVDATTLPLDIQVYRFPTASEQTYRPEQVGWYVDANISGANIDMTSSSISSYQGIESASLSMTTNSGSLSTQIPCSSTNASSGSTCSAGSESVGVVYTQPVAGPVEACFEFQHHINLDASGQVAVIFQAVETANDAQTVVREGGGKVGSGSEWAQDLIVAHPVRVCGIFNFTTPGQKTIRLMREQVIAATITANELRADASSANGQRDIHVTVKPIGQNVPMPIIVNSVSSSSTGQTKVEAAYIICDNPSSVGSQNGSWVSSVGTISGGNCTVTFTSGTFSAAPYCVATKRDGGPDDIIMTAGSATSSSVVLGGRDASAAAAASSFNANLVCIGAR